MYKVSPFYFLLIHPFSPLHCSSTCARIVCDQFFEEFVLVLEREDIVSILMSFKCVKSNPFFLYQYSPLDQYFFLEMLRNLKDILIL